MKRIICFITALCIVFGSFSYCFATPVQWDSSDSQHLTEIRNAFVSGGTIYNMINALNSNVANLNANLLTLMGWLDPSTGGSTSALLNQILNALTYTDAGGLVKSWLVDIQGYNYQTAERILDLKNLDNVSGISVFGTNGIPVSYMSPYGQVGSFGFTGYGNWRDNLIQMIGYINNNVTQFYDYLYDYQLGGHNLAQTYTDPLTLQSSTFTPYSETNGLYTWLSKIQNPAARLAYVLASPERIAAQDAAAAAEQQVVDDFIDPTGDSSATASDFGSISDLSSGYQQNFGSTASVSGIFDIFDSNNFGWFSSETYQQLDTTVAQRGFSFETPLLDQQLEDISRALGVDYAN